MTVNPTTAPYGPYILQSFNLQSAWQTCQPIAAAVITPILETGRLMLVQSQGVGGTPGWGVTPRPVSVCQPRAQCPSSAGVRVAAPTAGPWGPTALSPASLALSAGSHPARLSPASGLSSCRIPPPPPSHSLACSSCGSDRTRVRQAGCETQGSQDSRAKNTDYIRLPGGGRSSCQTDCSLAHLNPGRTKDGSIWSGKTGPPGKRPWTWWLQPQTSGSLSRGQGLPRPGVRCQLARAASFSATIRGTHPAFRVKATPLLGRQPRPTLFAPLREAAFPNFAAANQARMSGKQLLPLVAGPTTACVEAVGPPPYPRDQARSPGPGRACSRHNQDSRDPEKQEPHRQSPLDLV